MTTVPELVKEAAAVQAATSRRFAQWRFKCWLRRHWLQAEGKLRRAEDPFASLVWDFAADQVSAQEAAAFAHNLRTRQHRFFREELPNAQWQQLTATARPPDATEAAALVQQVLRLPEAAQQKVAGLCASGSLLLGSRREAQTMVLLHHSASYVEELSLCTTAKQVFREHRKALQQAEDGSRLVDHLAEEWMAKDYARWETSLQHSAGQHLKLAYDALVPYLLCQVGLVSQELGLEEPAWKAVCTPEILESCCEFWLGHVDAIEQDVDAVFAPGLWKTLCAVLVGFGYLVRPSFPGLQFGRLYLTHNKSRHAIQITEDSDMRKALWEWPSGLALAALLAVLQAHDAMDDKEWLLHNVFLRWLALRYDALADEGTPGQEPTGEVVEEWKDAGLVDALLATPYCLDLQGEVVERMVGTFRKQGVDPVTWGVFPDELASHRLEELVQRFPFGDLAYQRHHQWPATVHDPDGSSRLDYRKLRLTRFLQRKLVERCQSSCAWVLEKRKREQLAEDVPFVQKTLQRLKPKEEDDDRILLVDETIYAHTTAEFRQHYGPAQDKPSRRERLHLTFAVLKANKRKPKGKRLTDTELSVVVRLIRLAYSPRDPSGSSLRAALGEVQSTRGTPMNRAYLRKTLHGVAQKAPELRAVLSKLKPVQT